MSGHGNAPHAAERAIARFQQRGVDVVRNRRHRRRSRAPACSTMPSSAAPMRWWCAAATASSRLRCSRWRSANIPLGIIPAGTGNDHAREYRHSQKRSRSRRRRGRRRVDRDRRSWAASTVTPECRKWFGTVMAAGFDSLVSDRTNRMRWPHGRMRYNLAMVAELSQLAAAAVPAGVRRRRRDRRRPDPGRVRQHPKLRRRHADLPRRRPRRRPTRHHDGARDVADQADSAVPHRVQGHPRRPRRGHAPSGRGRSVSTPAASTPMPTANTHARCRSRCRRSPRR